MSSSSQIFVSTRALSGGTIQPAGTTYVDAGDSLSLSITPAAGFRAQKVTVNGRECDGNLACIELTEIDCVQYVIAWFEPIPQQYTVTPDAGAGGSIAPSEPQQIESGTSTTFYFHPETGYQIDEILVDGQPVGSSSSFTVNDVQSNTSISATFKAIPQTFVITPHADRNGSISPMMPVSVEEGSATSFEIKPDSHCEIEDVKVDGVSVGAVATYEFSNVDKDQTIDVTFKELEDPTKSDETETDPEDVDERAETEEQDLVDSEDNEEESEEQSEVLEPWAQTLEKWGSFTAMIECRLKGMLAITEKLYAETLELDQENLNTERRLNDLDDQIDEADVASQFDEAGADAQVENMDNEVAAAEEELETTEDQISRVEAGSELVIVDEVSTLESAIDSLEVPGTGNIVDE